MNYINYIASGIIVSIPLYLLYRALPKLIPEPISTKKQIMNLILWVLGVVIWGVALNVIITQSGLVNYSKGFAKASESLTEGTLLMKICCHVIVIPIFEELLCRGLCAGQICIRSGERQAIILSAIWFGIMHNNIVQFIYALLVGLALGAMYIKTKRLSLCIIAHGLINFIAIIFG